MEFKYKNKAQNFDKKKLIIRSTIGFIVLLLFIFLINVFQSGKTRRK
jgi:hypothetical protein